jgi:diguanylate cyclase (GGDEF)-like protein/PAS domain S-box-containing protein
LNGFKQVMPKSWRSLQGQLLVFIALGTLMCSLVAAGFAFHTAFDRSISNGRTSLEGLITAVEKTAAIGAYTGDSLLLQEIVEGLTLSPLSSYVEIRSVRGVVIASMQNGAGVLSGWGDGADHVERQLVSPFDQSEAIGSLRIMTNLAHLEALARQEATALAAMMIMQALLMALMVYVLAARLVSRPIVRLANDLREMEPGTGKRIRLLPGRHANEIGTLVGSANALLNANELALRRERDLRDEVETMQAQYRKIFTASSAGIFVLQANGSLINCNPTALKISGMAGMEPERLQGLDLVQEIFADADGVRVMMAHAARTGDTVAADLQLRTPQGQARWVHCLFSVQSGALDPVATYPDDLIEGVMYDITERKLSESAVLHQAEHDDLTGLKNRLASERIVDRFLADAASSLGTVSILYIDLDGFKQVNDLNGHKAGDLVLIECGVRMRAAVRRSTDLVGRVGGDEFLIALNHVGPDDSSLIDVALALIEAIRRPFELGGGRQAHIGVSIGVACYPQNGGSRIALLHQADHAMYEVKRTGKNSFALALSAGQ